MGRWAALAALVLVALGVLSCNRDKTRGLAHVRHTGVLRWGGDLTGGEPYVFEDPQRPGHLIGFEVELADAIAAELHVRAEFVQTDWPTLVASLDRGNFDLAMNGLEVTPQRSGQVHWTRPYFIFQERLMARRDDARITSLSSLRGLRVGTLANSLAWLMLERAGATPVPYDQTEQTYQDVVEGRTDAVLLDDIIAQRYGVQHAELHVVGDVGDGYYSVAVRRSEPELRDAVDAALARIAARGDLRRILERWNIDSPRQDRLATWTDADTRRMASVVERSSFNRHHVVLFLWASLVTLLISIASMAVAIPLGILVALGRLYAPKAVGAACSAYVELFRGTPVALQLYVLYFALASVVKVNAFTAAIIGLGLNYGAYEAEVYRAGIQAVPRGQMEAAVSLGMSTRQALARIIMPQAFRLALPSVTNDFIALLKDTSVLSMITVIELNKQMQITAGDTRSIVIPGILSASLYFVMSYPLSRLARRLEARLARS